ncbi:hypothetical protein [Candidatus Poriferisodalis sp.]|uniref:hypothetical protein n=1 Tax=Candidatus Poriferisodalis sp. TaxID=3101277 RepID=UPI003B5C31E3
MSQTDTQHDDIEVIVLSDDEVRVAVDNALAEAGCTWEELQAQAEEGCFTSELARRTWFIVSTFEPSTA